LTTPFPHNGDDIVGVELGRAVCEGVRVGVRVGEDEGVPLGPGGEEVAVGEMVGVRVGVAEPPGAVAVGVWLGTNGTKVVTSDPVPAPDRNESSLKWPVVRASWLTSRAEEDGSASSIGAARTLTAKVTVHRATAPGPPEGPRIRVPGPPGGVRLTSPVRGLGTPMVQVPEQPENPSPAVPVAVTDPSMAKTPGSLKPAGQVPEPSMMAQAGVWKMEVTVTVRPESTPGFPGSSPELLAIRTLTGTCICPT
jgi:hypothetical protein